MDTVVDRMLHVSQSGKSARNEEHETQRRFPPKTLASEADLRRRRSIGPLGFSHCAFRSKDLEATRHFYEDVLGMPLTLAEVGVQLHDPSGGSQPFDMIHIFFELADGSSIGFFGIEKGKLEPHTFPNNPLQLHFAVQIETEKEVRDVEVKVRNAGYKAVFVDHGACFSLYIQDPDGIQLEFCHHRPEWFAAIDVQEARNRLNQWVANGDRWSDATRQRAATLTG